MINPPHTSVLYLNLRITSKQMTSHNAERFETSHHYLLIERMTFWNYRGDVHTVVDER